MKYNIITKSSDGITETAITSVDVDSLVDLMEWVSSMMVNDMDIPLGVGTSCLIKRTE